MALVEIPVALVVPKMVLRGGGGVLVKRAGPEPRAARAVEMVATPERAGLDTEVVAVASPFSEASTVAAGAPDTLAVVVGP
jgi:hypothetical protein